MLVNLNFPSVIETVQEYPNRLFPAVLVAVFMASWIFWTIPAVPPKFTLEVSVVKLTVVSAESSIIKFRLYSVDVESILEVEEVIWIFEPPVPPDTPVPPIGISMNALEKKRIQTEPGTRPKGAEAPSTLPYPKKFEHLKRPLESVCTNCVFPDKTLS